MIIMFLIQCSAAPAELKQQEIDLMPEANGYVNTSNGRRTGPSHPVTIDNELYGSSFDCDLENIGKGKFIEKLTNKLIK